MTEETSNNETTEQEPQADHSGMAKAFDEFMDHQRRAFEETGKAIDALFPDKFKEHGAVARDEFRKGLKVLVDATIDELEKVTKDAGEPVKDTSDDDGPPPSTTGKTKVKVQVE